MTKSGDKLYGDFNRAYAKTVIDRRFWIWFGVMVVVIVGVGMFVGS